MLRSETECEARNRGAHRDHLQRRMEQEQDGCSHANTYILLAPLVDAVLTLADQRSMFTSGSVLCPLYFGIKAGH